MPCPTSWQNILEAPLYLINLERKPERLEIATKRIQEAGFKHILPWKAVDATKQDELDQAWNTLGNPSFDMRDVSFKKYKGTQGCAVSHYLLWKHMIDQKIPYMVVMEDDVVFHKHWHVLAPIYYEVTAHNYDILYLGNYNENNMLLAPILITPVFCTHAYVLTLEGARKLYSLCLKRIDGTFTIDSMLVYYMRKAIAAQGAFYPFRWYVWNGQLFPDAKYTGDTTIISKRNTGLVFQDPELESDVLPIDGEWVPTYIPHVPQQNMGGSYPNQTPYGQPRPVGNPPYGPPYGGIGPSQNVPPTVSPYFGNK
jgi:GR25 family glycosyltransferase involved in LPS biosynthesis